MDSLDAGVEAGAKRLGKGRVPFEEACARERIVQGLGAERSDRFTPSAQEGSCLRHATVCRIRCTRALSGARAQTRRIRGRR